MRPKRTMALASIFCPFCCSPSLKALPSEKTKMSKSFPKLRSGLPSCHRFPCLFISSSAPLRLALIPKLFTFCQCKFNLYFTVPEVHPRRDQRQPLLLRLAHQFPDLLTVHQQLASAQSGIVRITSMLIGTDMTVEQPQLTVFD